MGSGAQAEEPALGAYNPAAQLVHAPMAPALNLPDGQRSQSLPPEYEVYWPAGQLIHAVDPEDEYWPGAHSAQTLFSTSVQEGIAGTNLMAPQHEYWLFPAEAQLLFKRSAGGIGDVQPEQLSAAEPALNLLIPQLL